MTPEQIDAYAQLAERVKERFGDNWQVIYEPEYDDEASVRTEDSSRGMYTEVFVTSQTGGDDPLEVAGFLASAIDHVPALVAEVKRLTGELACMTAERDGYRDQLSADWQAQQIRDLMAAAGRAREERDEARRELNDLRESIRDDGTDCTWLADMVRDVITGVSLLGVQSPAEAKRVVSREVHSLLQANLLAARINSQVIDLAIEPIKAAERERDEARAALDRVRELLKRWGSDRAVAAALVVELHQALDGSGT